MVFDQTFICDITEDTSALNEKMQASEAGE